MTSALAVLSSDFFKLHKLVPFVKGSYLLNFNLPEKYFMVKRPACETDINYLQVIPYITLVNSNLSKVLTYRRGEAGNENRLHGNISLGFGGHIDSLPKNGLIQHMAIEGARELNEELNADITVVTDLLVKSMSNARVIFDNNNDVGKVHVGVSLIIDVCDMVFSEEENVITELDWVDYDSLELLREEGSLENWSNLVSYRLKYGLKPTRLPLVSQFTNLRTW